MAESKTKNDASGEVTDPSVLVKARREKLRRWREEFDLQPFGHRVDDLESLATARDRFDEAADDLWRERSEAVGEGEAAPDDPRPRARVAGRCVQHRAMGNLVFVVLRDDSGDLQISISKQAVDATSFKVASKLDYGDIVVAEGPVGRTKRGEICIWADQFELHCKSLMPPPEKYHGLTDVEARYRQRYVDLYMNPEVMDVFHRRSRILATTRKFMESRGYIEVETPMMQSLAGGAAARPFMTHHNALDMPLFMRIAPELYLKRLLVGGMRRVFEINRNFRNEGIDRQHNPEFTMMELYEAFGDLDTMLELVESLLRVLAQETNDGDGAVVTFGELEIDYGLPFERIRYGDLFTRGTGLEMADRDGVLAAAKAAGVEDADKRDHWLLVNELFEDKGESTIDPCRPTFVTHYPSAISPLTRPDPEIPDLSLRSELFIAGMEVSNAYTELNDPDVQHSIFTQQLSGADDEASTFRSMDEDFVNALRVGMPPAGGMGVGIDRVVMLMTGSTSIRDVILFPLLKPEGGEGDDAS
ncbi:MAG: lysine--tRNA ligase [Planctomycetota bacterium]|nr:lysine--tRNA ligase [Planctomycetota bacterium]